MILGGGFAVKTWQDLSVIKRSVIGCVIELPPVHWFFCITAIEDRIVLDSDTLVNVIVLTSGLVLAIFLSLVVLSYILSVIQAKVSKAIYAIGGTKALICIQFPGIIVHEISHALLCLAFFHKIDRICLYKPDFATGNLGYVIHSWNRNNIFQEIGNIFIGMAPIIIGPIILCFILQNFFPAIFQLPSDVSEYLSFSSLLPREELNFGFEMVGLLFLAASISLHTAPSTTDIKQCIPSLLSLVMVVSCLLIIAALVYGYGLNEASSHYIESIAIKVKTVFYIQVKMILKNQIFI